MRWQNWRGSRLNQTQSGFTLIEAVITIVLIGILAVAVAPKFSGTSGYDIYTYRDQIKAALRLTQIQAMQHTGSRRCHQLLITINQFGRPDVNACALPTQPGFSATWQDWQATDNTATDLVNIAVESNHLVQFRLNGITGNFNLNFDDFGRPTEACSGGCQIQMSNANETATIVIESEGYIHNG